MGPLVGQTVTRVCVCVCAKSTEHACASRCKHVRAIFLLLLGAAVWVAHEKRRGLICMRKSGLHLFGCALLSNL